MKIERGTPPIVEVMSSARARRKRAGVDKVDLGDEGVASKRVENRQTDDGGDTAVLLDQARRLKSDFAD